MEHINNPASVSVDSLAGLFSVLANPLRLKIMKTLIDKCARGDGRGMCVQEINALIDVAQPQVSKHLKVLSEHGMLKIHRDKNRRYYYVPHDSTICGVFEFFNSCCDKYEQIQKRGNK